MAAQGHFDTKAHAAAYKIYRSDLPEIIIKKIMTFLDETFPHAECSGIDVGCGSGQSTIPLGKQLKSIVGVDSSQAQVEAIDNIPNHITFKVGSASNLPLPNKSVHLVAAVNAVHWFDLKKFYEEVDRVLIPGGIVALVRGSPCIELKGAEDETTNLFLQLKKDTEEYWDAKSRFNDFLYRTIELPYKMFMRDESVITEEKLTLSFIMGRVKTFSGIAKLLREDPDKAKLVLEKYEKDLLKAIGQPDGSPDTTEVILKRQFILLMGRKPAEGNKQQ